MSNKEKDRNNIKNWNKNNKIKYKYKMRQINKENRYIN